MLFHLISPFLRPIFHIRNHKMTGQAQAGQPITLAARQKNLKKPCKTVLCICKMYEW